MTLEVFSDLFERLNYNLPDFPLYARKGSLRHFDRYAAAYHWHPDVEFILILDGSMEYIVNGQTIPFSKGEGIFVNSERLHYGFSATQTDCIFLVVVIHPSLLGGGTLAGKAYFEQKFGSATEHFLLLQPEVGWQQEVLDSIRAVYEDRHDGSENLFRRMSQAANLCALVSDHLQSAPQQDNDEHAWMLIRAMTRHIHQNHEKKIDNRRDRECRFRLPKHMLFIVQKTSRPNAQQLLDPIPDSKKLRNAERNGTIHRRNRLGQRFSDVQLLLVRVS